MEFKMSDIPIIADNKPTKTSIEAGKNYYFCACGRSANQPFCDGSHAGTGLKPMVLKAESTKDAYICMCKHTKNAPFCDGTHNQFTDDLVGKPGPGAG
jgi:CDGSH-type Zn-finger protein